MRDKKQLYFVALIALLCMLLIVSASLAWVAQSRNAKSTEQLMQIEPMGVVIEDYEVYKYNSEENRVEQITDGDLNMTPYDTIFEERNVNTPLLFVIHLRDLLESPAALRIKASCEEGHDFAGGEDTDNFTSNIVYLKAANAAAAISADPNCAEPADSSSDVQCETFFRAVCAYFADKNIGQQFLTFSGDTPTKVSEVSLDVSGVVPTDDDYRRATLYLIMDYDGGDGGLVDRQDVEVDFSAISQSTEFNLSVNFENDIQSFVFSYAD